MALAVALVAAVVAAPSVSDACSSRHQSVFEMFDEAATVAEVVVGKVPPPRKAGPVRLRVRRTLKGAGKAALTTGETNTSCHIGFRAGKRALVFLTKDGVTIGHYKGYREEVKRWVPPVSAWAAAKDDAARAAVLVDVIVAADRDVAYDAGAYLADQPQLLAQVGAEARARLIAAAETAHTHTMLPYVLVRLRQGAGVAKLVDAQRTALTAVRAETGFEKVADPSALADAILAGKGGFDPKRVAALERCERVHGRALFRFTQYATGIAEHLWPKLAEACRTGVPAQW